MATGALVLIIGTQLLFYSAVAYLIWSLRKKIAEHDLETGRALRETLSPRSNAFEHRIDVATSEASSTSLQCDVCAFSNIKHLRFCALCGNKLYRTPSELSRPRDELTLRQVRARRRNEWKRRLNDQGQVSWDYTSADPTRRGCDPTAFTISLVEEPEDATWRQNDELDSAQSSIQAREPTKSVRTDFAAASTADALAFPLSLDDSSSLGTISAEVKEILGMTDKAFPVKFAHFVARSSSMLRPWEAESLRLSVHRDYVVEESLEFFCGLTEAQLHSVVRIDFANETGIDAGGVHREWSMLLNELIVDEARGIFTCINDTDQTYYLKPAAESDDGNGDRLMSLFAAGRLIGRALLEGEVLGFHLAQPLLKMILGYPIAWDDLEYMDPVTHKNLQWMLENQSAEDLGLDFTVVEQDEALATARVVELVPDGANISVTDENKRDYVERKVQYLLVESVSSELHAFLKGFYQIIPRSILYLFDAQEFDYLLCGSDTIDVSDWEKHTRCSSSLRKSRVSRWFWQIVRDMPHEYRRRLLQFSTGCSRVPLVGFRGLTSYDGRICPFTLKGIPYDTSQYIRSHACFNRLDLPLYPSRSKLQAVLYGILDTEMYGFTTA